MKIRRLLLIAIPTALAAGITVILIAGSVLSAPSRRHVGDPPASLRATTVRFESPSGATIAAWLGKPDPGQPVVVLSHGVRGARSLLHDRARFLRDAGYGVLVYDAQAHGESSGEHITFGFLEALDARAAVDFVSKRYPDAAIGFIGPSLAGASALLGPEPIPVDALVLEAVYPTLESAVFNRLSMRLGAPTSRLLTPVLMLQVEPRLGFDPYALNPIDRIGAFNAPLLVIAGSEDHHTTIDESRALFDAANPPKELWIVRGAAHENFHRYAEADYEDRVTRFFTRHLRR